MSLRYFPTVTLYQKVVSSVNDSWNYEFLCMAGLPTSPGSTGDPKAPFFIACQFVCVNLMYLKCESAILAKMTQNIKGGQTGGQQGPTEMFLPQGTP